MQRYKAWVSDSDVTDGRAMAFEFEAEDVAAVRALVERILGSDAKVLRVEPVTPQRDILHRLFELEQRMAALGDRLVPTPGVPQHFTDSAFRIYLQEPAERTGAVVAEMISKVTGPADDNAWREFKAGEAEHRVADKDEAARRRYLPEVGEAVLYARIAGPDYTATVLDTEDSSGYLVVAGFDSADDAEDAEQAARMHGGKEIKPGTYVLHAQERATVRPQDLQKRAAYKMCLLALGYGGPGPTKVVSGPDTIAVLASSHGIKCTNLGPYSAVANVPLGAEGDAHRAATERGASHETGGESRQYDAKGKPWPC